MKKTLIAAAVMATSGIAFAASNVTLYGRQLPAFFYSLPRGSLKTATVA